MNEIILVIDDVQRGDSEFLTAQHSEMTTLEAMLTGLQAAGGGSSPQKQAGRLWRQRARRPTSC